MLLGALGLVKGLSPPVPTVQGEGFFFRTSIILHSIKRRFDNKNNDNCSFDKKSWIDKGVLSLKVKRLSHPVAFLMDISIMHYLESISPRVSLKFLL